MFLLIQLLHYATLTSILYQNLHFFSSFFFFCIREIIVMRWNYMLIDAGFSVTRSRMGENRCDCQTWFNFVRMLGFVYTIKETGIWKVCWNICYFVNQRAKKKWLHFLEGWFGSFKWNFLFSNWVISGCKPSRKKMSKSEASYDRNAVICERIYSRVIQAYKLSVKHLLEHLLLKYIQETHTTKIFKKN